MPYFATYTGRKIDLETISENDICLEDIAHHLTQIQRFGGALPFGKVYSVAEHSLRIADYLIKSIYCDITPNLIRNALLHDAAEAYLGDLITGLKGLVPEYKVLERKVEGLIFSKYKVQRTTHYDTIVKQVDTRIVLDEVLGLMPEKYELYQQQLTGVKPLGIEINGLSTPEFTKQLFLDTCKNLQIRDLGENDYEKSIMR